MRKMSVLLKDEFCHYAHFSTNDKVFSSMLGLSLGRVIQSGMRTHANPSCFPSSTEMQSDNLFLKNLKFIRVVFILVSPEGTIMP